MLRFGFPDIERNAVSAVQNQYAVTGAILGREVMMEPPRTYSICIAYRADKQEVESSLWTVSQRQTAL